MGKDEIAKLVNFSRIVKVRFSVALIIIFFPLSK